MKKFVFLFSSDAVEDSNIVIVESIDVDNAFTNALKQMSWTDDEICELLDGNAEAFHFGEVYYKEIEDNTLPISVHGLDLFTIVKPNPINETQDGDDDCKCDGER